MTDVDELFDAELPASATHGRPASKVAIDQRPRQRAGHRGHWSVTVEGLPDLQGSLSTTFVAPTRPRPPLTPEGLTDQDAQITFTSATTGRPKMPPLETPDHVDIALPTTAKATIDRAALAAQILTAGAEEGGTVKVPGVRRRPHNHQSPRPTS